MGKTNEEEKSKLRLAIDFVRGKWGTNQEYDDRDESTPKNVDLKKAKSIYKGEFLKSGLIKNNIGLIGLGAVLLFIYVGNRFFCEWQFRTLNELDKKLKDARYDCLTYKSELMEISRQSKVKEKVRQEGMPLKESTVAPYSLD